MDNNLTYIADKVANGTWLLNGETFDVLAKQVESRLANDTSIIHRFTSVISSLLEKKASFDEENKSLAEDSIPSGARIGAIIPVVGILIKGASERAEQELGVCNIDKISEALDEAIADNSVKEIYLAFNSPGGEVMGIEVLARKIATLSQIKPIHAWTENECASAAYWLMSQCTDICMTPDAQVGSVGVVTTLKYFKDGATDKDGRTVEQIISGKYKLIGLKLAPPTEEERNMIKTENENTYIKFKAAITSKRAIKDEDLQGLMYEADKAIALGYADKTSDTLTDYLNNKETNMKATFTKVALAEVTDKVTEVPAVITKTAEAEQPEHKDEPEKKADVEDGDGQEMKHAKAAMYSMVSCPHCSKSFALDHDEEKHAEASEEKEPEHEKAEAKKADVPEKEVEAKAESLKQEASLPQGFTMGELMGLRPRAEKNKLHANWESAMNERV